MFNMNCAFGIEAVNDNSFLRFKNCKLESYTSYKLTTTSIIDINMAKHFVTMMNGEKLDLQRPGLEKVKEMYTIGSANVTNSKAIWVIEDNLIPATISTGEYFYNIGAHNFIMLLLGIVEDNNKKIHFGQLNYFIPDRKLEYKAGAVEEITEGEHKGHYRLDKYFYMYTVKHGLKAEPDNVSYDFHYERYLFDKYFYSYLAKFGFSDTADSDSNSNYYDKYLEFLKTNVLKEVDKALENPNNKPKATVLILGEKSELKDSIYNILLGQKPSKIESFAKLCFKDQVDKPFFGNAAFNITCDNYKDILVTDQRKSHDSSSYNEELAKPVEHEVHYDEL